MTRSAQLQTYLMEQSATTWADGESDCCTFAADWIVSLGLADPMARWRGKYEAEWQWRNLVAEADGLENLWLLGMTDAGFYLMPDTPQLGDVGIVAVRGCGGRELVGAIYGGKRWVSRSPRGIFSASMRPEDVIMCWRV